MADDACRQRYRLGTGKGLDASPVRTAAPGFKKGGPARKQAGGAVYKAGGKAKR